jgi:cytochrome c5
MNPSKMSKALTRRTFTTVFAAMVASGLAASSLCSAQPTAGAQPAVTNSAPVTATPPAAAAVKLKTQLSGAELYSMHCNRCHPERYPTERTAAQWKTIMLHMQVRANIPAEQSRQILKYLQENSGR